MPHALMDISGIIFLCFGLVLYYFASTNLYYDESLVDGYSLTAFGSKTAYRNNGLRSKYASLLNLKRLVHVNSLHRHGTRSPDVKFSKKVEKYRSLLHPLLPGWNFSTKSCGAGEKLLLSTGYDELKGMGCRMRKLLPEEFSRASNMRAVSSDTQRTRASAESFLTTYTDDNVDITIDQDRVRFFAYCNNYHENIRSSDISKVEYRKFKDGPEMHAVLKEVIMDHKLDSLNLTVDDIANLYKIASYEVSVMGENESLPDWVRLFRPDHLYVLEYLHDLKQYWTKGNAFPVNYEQVCPLWGKMLADMREAAIYDMQLMEAQINGNNQSIVKLTAPPKCVFWFGHAETLLPMVAKLGMFNESVASEHGGGSHLSADGFPSRLQRLTLDDPPVPNLFRSSHIIPFGANLDFFLFYNPIKGAKPSLNDYCIEVRLNEKVVEMIPQDKNATRPLRLEYVLHYFQDCLPETYDIQAVCGIKANAERIIPE
nr:multiple inositol polyphosphate phosphatase [Hymenolepis microstoma]